MFRRSRLAIRPNVGTTGRTAATPQEAPPSNQESSEPPKDSSEKNSDTGTDDKSAVVQSEQTPPAGDRNDQNGESTTSSAALQRRKRFSIKPRVAPGRPATLPRTPKSPIKPVLQSHVEVPSSDLNKPTSSQVDTTAPPQALLSPRHRRASDESRQANTQPKPTLTSSGSSETLSVPPAEDSVEQLHQRTDGGKKESASAGQVKEVSPRQPDKVPPSLPDKEAIEISEKAKTLVSSKSVISTSPSKFSLSRLLNDPSDLQRLEKAQKLRELLRKEIHKEKKLRKAKARVKEYTLDPAKMTMRDLIHYLPMSNPMTSTLQESVQENETVVPQSPVREESPERAKEPQVQSKMASPRQPGEEEVEEEEEATVKAVEVEEKAAAAEEADDDEDAFMVPQVKVAEDGSLIIDEESLTVEVQRMKGPNPVQDRDPIFERGSTTTYASFRKGTYAKPWSSEETDMFFLAISMVGTDFTMICQLFPHRSRSEIKNKFKKEERDNAWRIDKAFRERRKLDIEYFTKLLEKILEVEKNRKKLRSLSEKNKTRKKRIRKSKGKKAARKLSDVEEEDEVDEEEEGEKENEELCNEGGSPVSKPKRKHKRNDEGDESPEQPDSKKSKRGKKKKKQGEASVPTDTEAALPEDHTTPDQCDAPKDAAIKPANWEGAPQVPPPVSKDASPSRQTDERDSADENLESDEEFYVKPPKPTRYGRVPKLTQHLNYAIKEETHSSASETAPASPAGHTASAAKAKPKAAAKRGRPARQQAAKESKKPKLITLRASQSEDSDDEDDQPRAAEASCLSIDGGAVVFVPAGLCSPQPLITEVEETMEELDILANMPDVLGIHQDALCPEASCEQAQNEAGTAEPCEHQLDLLVDVIEFLSSEPTEVSEDESYNEAAQTLLTIGNVAHLSHPSQSQVSMDDLLNASVIASESIHQEVSQSMPFEQQEISTCSMSVASAQEITEPSETVGTVEPETYTTEERPPSPTDDTSITKPGEETYSEQKTEAVSDPQLQSNPESSKKSSTQTKKGRFSKIKPKPNIARASRTTQSNSQSDNNKASLRTAEDGHSSASDIFQDSHSEQVPETISEFQNSGLIVAGEISCTDVRLTEEPSGHQEAGRSVIPDQSTSENQTRRIPETRLESSRENQLTPEPTDEKLPLPDRTCDFSYSDSLASNTVTGSASVCEGADLVCVSPVNQNEETEVTNTSETRREQFHEIKSTDILLQASETEPPKTQTTQDPVTHSQLEDKPSIQTVNPQPTEEPAEKMETEPTVNASLPETPTQSTGPDSVYVPSVNMDSTHETAEKPSVTEEKKTDVEFASQADSCSESSEQNAPQRRRRFPKVKPKPNLGSSPRSTQSRAQIKCLGKSSNQLCKDSSSNAPSEQQPVEENSAKTPAESAQRDSQPLTPAHCSLNIELSSANAGNTESEKSSGSTNEKDAQSDTIVMATSWVAESKTTFTDSASENKTDTTPPVEESTGGCISNQDKVETLDTGAASLCNTEQEINSRTAESNTQPVGDPSTGSNVQRSHDVSVPTTEAEAGAENTQQPQSQPLSDAQSQDAGQHRSETSETNQENKDKRPPQESLRETQDAPADSSKASRKPPQTQRGRFIKPKPNLGRSGRPQRPQGKAQTPTDSDVCSDSADASDSQKAVPELGSDVQETLEGAREQVGGLDAPPADAGSSLSDLTQAHDTSAQSFQVATTSSTAEPLNYQSLSIFQDILTEQVPSDPDEPFFVLSLTAIPVCPSGEVLDTVSEPYLPVTDALAQQESSGPGETVTAGSQGSFDNIHVPTSTEASNETELISGKDIGPHPASLLTERPEDPQEGTSAQPPNLPDATVDTQESDDPPTKQKLTGRRAKVQVKSKTARNRQARNKESLAAKEANKPLQTNTTRDPEIPGPSVQPEATDSTETAQIEVISEPQEEGGHRLVTDKSGKAVEERSSGAQSQTTESRGKRQTRKSKNVLPVTSETNPTEQAGHPPQAEPSARSRKVKAPRAARRTRTPPAVAAASHDVAHSPVPEETHSTAAAATSPSHMQTDVQEGDDHSQPTSETSRSTSQSTAEVVSIQSDGTDGGQADDEPTSVSQYFFSDIFTDVEDE